MLADTVSSRQTLRDHRIALNLTLAQASQRVGCSISNLSRVECGRQNVSIPLAKKLAELYSVTLLDVVDAPKAPPAGLSL